MSDTPRTDAITLDSRGAAGVLEDHHALCIALERELTALQSELAAERMKREAAERRLAEVLAEADRLQSALALIAWNPDNALSPKLIANSALAREK